MSNITINNNVDVNLLQEFRFVKKLLIEKFSCRLVKEFSFAIDFSIKDKTNLLTN